MKVPMFAFSLFSLALVSGNLASASPSDPRNYYRCYPKVQDVANAIYAGGSFSEDCSTLEMAPVTPVDVKLIGMETDGKLCEEFYSVSDQISALMKKQNEIMKRAIKPSDVSKMPVEKLSARVKKAMVQIEAIFDEIHKLREVQVKSGGGPVVKAKLKVSSSASSQNEAIRVANPGLTVTAAPIWDLSIHLPEHTLTNDQMPAVIRLSGPTIAVEPDAFEKDGVMVDLELSANGACYYYDQKAKALKTDELAKVVPHYVPATITYKVIQDGEERTLNTNTFYNR